MKKYLVTLAFLVISTSASAQLGEMWRNNRERAIDQQQRQLENMQRFQQDLWLYRGGDWYMYDDVYGARPNVYLQELQRQRRLRQLELDDDE
jgi:hypothetical protein